MPSPPVAAPAAAAGGAADSGPAGMTSKPLPTRALRHGVTTGGPATNGPTWVGPFNAAGSVAPIVAGVRTLPPKAARSLFRRVASGGAVAQMATAAGAQTATGRDARHV